MEIRLDIRIQKPYNYHNIFGVLNGLRQMMKREGIGVKHIFSKKSLEERFFKNLYVFILGICVVFIQSLIEETKSDKRDLE